MLRSSPTGKGIFATFQQSWQLMINLFSSWWFNYYSLGRKPKPKPKPKLGRYSNLSPLHRYIVASYGRGLAKTSGILGQEKYKLYNLNIIMTKRVSAELQLHSTVNMDDFASVISEMKW